MIPASSDIVFLVLYNDAGIIVMNNQPTLTLILRLYSGLKQAILQDKWSDVSGTPAISKLIDRLVSKSFKMELHFYADEIAPFKGQSSRSLYVSALKQNVYLHYLPFFYRYLPKLGSSLSVTLYWAFKTLQIAIKRDIRVLYSDRSNILGAALVGRFFKKPVILRILGITHGIFFTLKRHRPMSFLLRFAYKTRFRLVIATEDGSFVRVCLKDFMHPSIVKHIKLNGIKRFDPGLNEIKDQIKIVFLGRLEITKQPLRLLMALSRLDAGELKRIKVSIIGDGAQKNDLQAMVKKNKLESVVTFLGALRYQDAIKLVFLFEAFQLRMLAVAQLPGVNKIHGYQL
ncbi:MAG: glycosyltransferase, partial [Pseudomonadota bacterium]